MESSQPYGRVGRVGISANPNGIVTEFIWHPRDWLKLRTVKCAGTPKGATTTYPGRKRARFYESIERRG